MPDENLLDIRTAAFALFAAGYWSLAPEAGLSEAEQKKLWKDLKDALFANCHHG